jgi:hypothetical protein
MQTASNKMQVGTAEVFKQMFGEKNKANAFLPRLQEWAYAGIFFNMTGAAASVAMSGYYGINTFHFIVPLFFALAVAAWYLRPSNRKLKQA